VNSATAVGANYRATSRARSRAEFVAKLAVAVEEADEAVYWLELACRIDAVAPGRVEPLLREAKELRAMLAASSKTARHNARRQNVRR
jgi:four helix bundle protein